MTPEEREFFRTNGYVSLGQIYAGDELARMVWLLVAEGRLKPVIDMTFPLDDAPEGHKYLEAGKSKGKVLFKI